MAKAPSPMLRAIVLRAVRRAGTRAIGAGVVFGSCGLALVMMDQRTNVGGLAMIGLGVLGVVAGLLLVWRGARRPMVRALLTRPEQVVRITGAPSGEAGAVRIIFADGGELTLGLSAGQARHFATMLAGFCRKAEITLPWLQRPAGG